MPDRVKEPLQKELDNNWVVETPEAHEAFVKGIVIRSSTGL